uniref:HDC14323 n=1 Tax=Drosophila melanogaster TaxID=7227 RepID=Q6IJS7_DROME|nr:TPA_inf: HDC14323 [Drosophila melanogaster]
MAGCQSADAGKAENESRQDLAAFVICGLTIATAPSATSTPYVPILSILFILPILFYSLEHLRP